MPRPFVTIIALAAAVALVGCSGGSGEGQRNAGHRPSTAGSSSPSASAGQLTPTASAMPSSSPGLTLPDGTRVLFPGHRVVAYYGAAGAPSLGVLGHGSPEQIWPRLARAAHAFDADGPPVMPAYELISFVATGGHGTAALRVPDSTIARYVASGQRHHALVILDIQPGRSTFLGDARSLRRWLVQPGVALALDPEWQLHGHQQAGQQIGHTSAAAINAVSRWLDALTARRHLPQKLLLVHQFTSDMIRDKPAVAKRSHLAIAFNMDGFGSRAGKLSKYRLLASDHRFPIGMKLFYRSDVHMFSPAETAALHPAPAIVDYE